MSVRTIVGLISFAVPEGLVACSSSACFLGFAILPHDCDSFSIHDIVGRFDRREDVKTALPFLHSPTQFLPSSEAGDPGSPLTLGNYHRLVCEGIEGGERGTDFK